MSLTVIFAGVAAILLVSWLYSVYVSVIKAKNKVEEAMASVDVQLKKRYDLMPNVLFLANKFMEHERSLIEDLPLRIKLILVMKFKKRWVNFLSQLKIIRS